jgi:hypothetical protein
LATAPPVLSAGAEPVGEALAPEALEAECEAVAEAAAPLAAEAAAEGARLAGTETEMPAASQMPARMGTSSVVRISIVADKTEREEAGIQRTGLVLGLALARHTGGDGLGDSGLAGGALALDVRDTAARLGDGGDKAGNLVGIWSVYGLSSAALHRKHIQRSWGPGTGQGSGPRQRRAKRQRRRWWRNAC